MPRRVTFGLTISAHSSLQALTNGTRGGLESKRLCLQDTLMQGLDH